MSGRDADTTPELSLSKEITNTSRPVHELG